jgi:hypothetical protein
MGGWDDLDFEQKESILVFKAPEGVFKLESRLIEVTRTYELHPVFERHSF